MRRRILIRPTLPGLHQRNLVDEFHLLRLCAALLSQFPPFIVPWTSDMSCLAAFMVTWANDTRCIPNNQKHRPPARIKDRPVRAISTSTANPNIHNAEATVNGERRVPRFWSLRQGRVFFGLWRLQTKASITMVRRWQGPGGNFPFTFFWLSS